MEKHAYILEREKKQIVKYMVICHGIIILLLFTIIINIIIIILNILDIDVFSSAGNIMQIAYTNDFGMVRKLNDIVLEFP